MALTLAWMVVGVSLAALAVGPVVWLVRVALQPAGVEMNSWGGGVTWSNVSAAWRDGELGRPMVNSVIVTVARAGLNVLLAGLAAYPLARMRFRGRDTIFVLLLATMMIPEQVIVVPMFRVVVGMGLFDSLIAVVLPFSVTAFGIYLCRQAFLAIPMELEEAARMDGAGALRVWWHVMMPLAAPTLATLGLFSVIGTWSELLWPLVVLQSREQVTLPVALNSLLGVFSTNVRAAYAGAALALVPVLAVYVLSQRFLRAELFSGAVKG
jgi:putative chitobiose transport system permease protein